MKRTIDALDPALFYARKRLNGECWEFTGNVHKSTGYGRVYVGGGKYVHTHVHSYALSIGPVPKGLCVCHTCDNRLCINPAHFFLGTRADNTRDMYAKGRNGDPWATRQQPTHCRHHGVELTPENTVRRGVGRGRYCRACASEATKRWGRAHGKAWRAARSPEQKAKDQARRAEWRRRNPDKTRAYKERHSQKKRQTA